MKCKECGAKIPDNKKFCIDCGAWVNPPEERQCIHNSYYEPERYRYTPSVSKNYEQRDSNPSAYNKNSNKNHKIYKGVTLAGIVIAIFAVFIASMLMLNTVDKLFPVDSWNEDLFTDSIIIADDIKSVDFNDGYADEQEQLALEYVENYVKGMDYATFDKFTALDTEKVYTDIMNNHIKYNGFTTEEQFYNDLQDIYEEPVSDIQGYISADLKSVANSKLEYFADMYNTQDISYAVTYSCKIYGNSLYDYYYRYTDEILADAGKKTSDYLPDYNDMTNIYDIGVDFIINDGYETYYETVWLVVADAGNGPEIVYDELLIDEMLNTINY